MRNKRDINDIIEDTVSVCLSLWALAVSYAAYKTLQQMCWYPPQKKVIVQTADWQNKDPNIFFPGNLSTIRSR